ncbi:MAG: NTP transferase domain-containing protein [Syntrophomonadaceae bacterium]|nr:NTP transferase domain-containing protein [Syntrophomonadaceae bacterium]
MRVDAVVLAGGLNSSSLRENSGCTSEALISIGNRPMVEYVVKALKHTPEVSRIVVAGHRKDMAAVFAKDPELILTESGPTTVSTLLNGLQALREQILVSGPLSDLVLVTAGDIPMITPEAIQNFLGLCHKRKADLYYPIVTREASESKYPGMQRTYVRLREGYFTGGNLILVDPTVVERCAKLADQMILRRKNPLALCQLLGWRFVLKFLFHYLSLPEVEKKVSTMLGINGVAVISDYPEVGVDVDKPSDLQLARRLLKAGC